VGFLLLPVFFERWRFVATTSGWVGLGFRAAFFFEAFFGALNSKYAVLRLELGPVYPEVVMCML
jgi:hypothetical protein